MNVVMFAHHYTTQNSYCHFWGGGVIRSTIYYTKSTVIKSMIPIYGI